MKIAILSDSHDHLDNLTQALERINALGADALLFCGDFCAPPVAAALVTFPKEIHIVLGNNDGDRLNIARRVLGHDHVTLHGEHAELILDGKRIGMTHYPFYADKMAKSGDFDLVCFGHDHKARIENYDACLAVNPGALNNMMTGGEKASFALYDTQTHSATLYTLD